MYRDLRASKIKRSKLFLLTVPLFTIGLLNGCGGGGADGSSNLAPVANAGLDSSSVELSSISLNGNSSSDTDGTIQRYLWSQISNGAPNVTLTDANTASPSFTAPDVSTVTEFSFQLEVTDDDGGSATDTVMVEITSKLPEASVTTESTVLSGNNLSLNAKSNLGWLYRWEQTLGPIVIITGENSSSAEFVAPTFLENTGVKFRLTVSDADGNTDEQEVSVDIMRRNPDANAYAGVDRVGATSSDHAKAIPNVFINGAASTGLNFSWSVTKMPEGANYRFTSGFDPVTGFVADIEGNYTLSLAVDNGQGSSDIDEMTVALMTDADLDGLPDSQDTDSDGDGFANSEDKFPTDKASHIDSDSNGIGNYYNADEDGDNIADVDDAFPLDPLLSILPTFVEASETNISFNKNDGISVAEFAGSAPLSVTGFVQAASQAPDLDYYRVTLDAGVFTVVMDSVGGNLQPTVNLVTSSGVRLATSSQTSADANTKSYSVILVPSPDDYYLIVGDATGQSGTDWSYSLSIQSDTDRDGIADDVEIALDINHLTSDSDGDSISDLIELTIAKLDYANNLDADDDGLPLWWDTDSDGDSVPDSIEYASATDFPDLTLMELAALNDADQDGLPNFVDTDSDGNSVVDADEIGLNPFYPLDSDGDGQPDFIDMDNDNDGLPDIDESLVNMNLPLGLGGVVGSPFSFVERLDILSIENTSLNLEYVCREGDQITIEGRNFPASQNSLWGVMNWFGGTLAVVASSMVDDVATFDCPIGVSSGLIEFFVATSDKRSDSVPIQAMANTTPLLRVATYDANRNLITLDGDNLDTDLSIQLKGVSTNSNNTSGSPLSVDISIPVGATTGYVTVSSSEGESNAVWLITTRQVSGTVILPGTGVAMEDLDLGVLDDVVPDSTGNFFTEVDSTGVQTLSALVELPTSTEENPQYSPFLSAIVLPGENIIPLSADTTALALIWQGLGIEQLVDESALVSIKTSLMTLTEMSTFTDALKAALAADPYALNTATPVFLNENKIAMLAAAQWLADYLTKTPSLIAYSRMAVINPTEADDISVYEYGTEGNVTVENDSQLYLSAKVTASDGTVLQSHITGLSGMVGPQGYGLLFWASSSQLKHPQGHNATVEVITAGIDETLDPQRTANMNVWSKLFFRTWVERVLWPVLGEFLPADASDMTNIIVTHAPALVDTVTTKALAGDVKGSMSSFLDLVWQDFFSVPPGPITQAVAKKYGKQLGVKILAKIAAKVGAKFVPGIGQIALAVEIAGHVNNGVNAAKAVTDVATTDSIINFEVTFKAELDSVEPSKVKADELSHRFVLKGSGFTKIKRGTWPFNTYLTPEITFTDNTGREYWAEPDSISSDGKLMTITVPAYYFDEDDLEGPISVEVHHPTYESDAIVELEDAIGVVDTLEITSLSPDSGGTGAAVTIYGTGFNLSIGLNEVTVGGLPVLVTSVSADSLGIVIPDGLDEGNHNVIVRALDDGNWTDWVGPLTYEVEASQVSINVCDDGGLKDDAFALYVDGTYLGTMYASNSDYCDTYNPTLSNGAHTAILIGVEAPDSVGTYSISFSGVSSVTGSSTSGSDLTPGVRKLYNFDVDSSASNLSILPRKIQPALQQQVQEITESMNAP